MRNYDEMSDFEINKAVADCKGLFWHVKPNTQGDSDGWVYSENYERCNTKVGQRAIELPDYCDDAARAWPIIVKNKIGIQHFNNGTWQSHCKGDEVCHNANPLRAAMIVFLMMQESKDA